MQQQDLREAPKDDCVRRVHDAFGCIMIDIRRGKVYQRKPCLAHFRDSGPLQGTGENSKAFICKSDPGGLRVLLHRC